ncbi:MAG: hypothetical protein IPK19_26505 [Chloroflexi bacterium]|nr:hypothetical protein [Chloroflexota bacterium]
MSSKQIRLMLRTAHIILGACIGAFLYVPPLRADATFAGLVQFLIVPVLALSGVAMWQLPRFNKWRSRNQRAAANA